MTATLDTLIPRINQGFVAICTAVGFVLDTRWLVAVAFAVLLVSRVGGPRVAPITRLYTDVLRPRFLADRPVVTEDARPPRFAQLLGTIFLGIATGLLFGGATTAGWVVTLMVTALATLASVASICVGCIFYRRVLAR